MEKNGLSKSYDFSITDKAMKKLISLLHPGSRRAEPGAEDRRDLPESGPGDSGEKSKGSIKVTETNLEELSGQGALSRSTGRMTTDEIGIVRGLAWTSVGGDTLQIEVNVMPGKGELLLTGQLGDVMKESAHDGHQLYPFRQCREYGIDDKFFKET